MWATFKWFTYKCHHFKDVWSASACYMPIHNKPIFASLRTDRKDEKKGGGREIMKMRGREASRNRNIKGEEGKGKQKNKGGGGKSGKREEGREGKISRSMQRCRLEELGSQKMARVGEPQS